MISTKDCALIKGDTLVIFEYDSTNVEIFYEGVPVWNTVKPVAEARVEYRRLQSLGFVPTKDY
jgi:hypothetical protein